MIRGAVYRWQQPICFYFCQGSTIAIYLKAIIEKVTLELIRAGLFPVAFISDQGASFRSTLRQMQENTRRQQLISGCKTDDTIKIQAHNINVIFDPPHLMKGLRNNFLTKDIILDGKISKWRDIIDVYLTDCKQTEIRLLHKLNDEHVIPEKNKKMKRWILKGSILNHFRRYFYTIWLLFVGWCHHQMGEDRFSASLISDAQPARIVRFI
ncbi:hypothetical protein K1T71_015070 [Dendrolimus kikuchii]|nr:hypothetical protein K1T71_015070 [Dendrolimus kikuchii]